MTATIAPATLRATPAAPDLAGFARLLVGDFGFTPPDAFWLIPRAPEGTAAALSLAMAEAARVTPEAVTACWPAP